MSRTRAEAAVGSASATAIAISKNHRVLLKFFTPSERWEERKLSLYTRTRAEPEIVRRYRARSNANSL
jgi:hypothetical protein